MTWAGPEAAVLAEQLEELLRLMTGGFDQPPRPGRVLLIEVSAHHPLSSHGRLIARRSDLATIAEYSPRFAELVHAGYAWINLSFYGLDGADGIVGVETPREPIGNMHSSSINFSGPSTGAHATSSRAAAFLSFDDS